MFVTIIVLTAVAVGFEIMLVNKIPGLLNILERFKLAALVFSLILSVMLGAIFGAAGLIVFVAGLCSTFVVQPYYRLKKRGTIDLMHDRIDALKAQYAAKSDVYKRRAHQLARGVVFTWKVCMIPFILIGAGLDRIDQFTSACARMKARLSHMKK